MWLKPRHSSGTMAMPGNLWGDALAKQSRIKEALTKHKEALKYARTGSGCRKRARRWRNRKAD
jgi:hypothetical protein